MLVVNKHFELTSAALIRTQLPQQVSGGLKEVHAPRILQLALLTPKVGTLLRASTRASRLGSGLGEAAALGAATTTVLESARMNASKEIGSPRMSILCMQWESVRPGC